MSPDAAPLPAGGFDPDRLARYLADTVDPAVTGVEIRRLSGGHSSGAWRLDLSGPAEAAPLVLKAPAGESIVYGRDAAGEGRTMRDLHRQGAPVPGVVAIDEGTAAVGRPCFFLEYVDGRSVLDEAPGYHGGGWLYDASPEAQRAVWESFHDALAALHSADPADVPDARHGGHGCADLLGHWRTALLDAAPADVVPRQLAALEWLREHIPPGADDAPAVCLGDARLVNGVVVGTEVRALVDFEVVYVGNPAADVGYNQFYDGLQRRHVAEPLPGFPTIDETWERWGRAAGRPTGDREYWTAFSATILCITATRAMIQWGMSSSTIEADNTIVAAWETAVATAVRV